MTRPSHAATANSGTRADDRRERGQMAAVARQMLATHRAADAGGQAPPDRDAQTRECLPREAGTRHAGLAAHPEDKQRAKGRGRRSHRTDHESATRATAKGVIQGDTGVAAVDAPHQRVVEAQAHGTGAEPEWLVPVVEATARLRPSAPRITADAGDHAEDHRQELAGKTGEAYLGDHGYRQRDARDAGQAPHQDTPDPLGNQRPQPAKRTRVGPAHFRLAEDGSHGTCPAGKRRYSNGSNGPVNGDAATKFRGAPQAGGPGTRRPQGLRTPEQTKTRQVACFQGARAAHARHTERMQARIDSARGRPRIAWRVAPVAPVFGHVRHHTRLDRCTRRGRAQVEGPWQRSGLTHTIETLAHHGYAP